MSIDSIMSLISEGVQMGGDWVIDSREYYEDEERKPMSVMGLCEANREQLLAWNQERRSYWWMGRMIGIPERSRSVVSRWFIANGIRRKVAKNV